MTIGFAKLTTIAKATIGQMELGFRSVRIEFILPLSGSII